MMSLRDVGSLAGVGWDTVKRIFQSDMAKEAARINLKAVELLAIDEVYLGHRHKFITIVIDWQSGRVLYVAKGRGEGALGPFFRRLRLAKARIKAVATDLSAAYAAAVIKHLPGALLVADRFHIIKLMNEKIDELRRSLQREATIMGRAAIKGTRYLLLRGRENLRPEQLPQLEEALKLNEPLSIAYYLKGNGLIANTTVDPKTQKMIPPPGCLEAYQKYLDLAPTGLYASEVKAILASFAQKVDTTYKAPKPGKK